VLADERAEARRVFFADRVALAFNCSSAALRWTVVYSTTALRARPRDGELVFQAVPGAPGWAAAAMAMAVGVLRDSSPVIVGGDGSVRVWRLADGAPLAHPLDLPEPSWVVALRGNIIVTAGGRDIGIHQPGAP
jgi:hypothetical protein